jgi:hypothetical protein
VENKIMFAVVAGIVEYSDYKTFSIHSTREEAERAVLMINKKIRELETLHSAFQIMMRSWEENNPPAKLSAWGEARKNEKNRLLEEMNIKEFPHMESVEVVEIPMLTPEKVFESWDSWAATKRWRTCI